MALCEEKNRLIEAYAVAAAALSEAVTVLTDKDSPSEYPALLGAYQTANSQAEDARIAFERHRKDHGC